ncbi:50S ribosomal protein L16 [Patescibacteria group bacterium]|jgi:large subunit ribosomal protein L16|nr:50S ribosomal protein L16 [Patescibacteria group bacterium]
MLFPKKVKHRKWQTGRRNPNKVRVETRGTTLSFGAYGLKSMSEERVKSNQIEAARRVISRSLGKTGRIWIRIFPDRPFTKKAAEVPMGKGKGDPEYFVFEVLPGRLLFEVDGVTRAVAQNALIKAGKKLPIKTKFVSREVAS